MKNRSWFCYALDILGLLALAGAGLTLATGLWFAGGAPEAALLVAFKYSLVTAVGAFLVARCYEIRLCLRRAAMDPGAVAAPLDNVQSLPTNTADFPRAA